MPVPPIVNFINILHANFSFKSASSGFSLVTIWIWIFWYKNIAAKGACKMLIKLTPNYTCVRVSKIGQNCVTYDLNGPQVSGII